MIRNILIITVIAALVPTSIRRKEPSAKARKDNKIT